MTEARRVLLSDKWPQMTGPQRMGCINPIFQKMKQLQDLEFPAYGSLLFYKEISLVSTKKFHLDCGICLSQHCGIGYWDSDSTSRAPIHRGPCKLSGLLFCRTFRPTRSILQGETCRDLRTVWSMWALHVSPLNFLQLHSALHATAHPKSIVTCSPRLAPSYRRYRQARVYRKPQDRSYITPISTLATYSYPSMTRPSSPTSSTSRAPA